MLCDDLEGCDGNGGGRLNTEAKYIFMAGLRHCMMLKLKLRYFGHLIRRADSLEKALMLGKIEGKRNRGRHDEIDGWMSSLNQWT